jgi:MFS family permease
MVFWRRNPAAREPMTQTGNSNAQGRWYEGVTRYQWIVLIIASLGWVFDVFEGQIFVASMNEAMPSLMPPGTDPGVIRQYNDIALGSFLLGGALGGVVFGMLSDRIGRTRTMIYTILMYSLFTCVTAFARGPWEMIVLRFLVAMGVGGEWAVASAMVAEVMPKKARAWSLGIFHASSVLGTYLAIAAGAFIVGNENLGWRWGFAIGAVPALLTLWIRWRLKEPEQWTQARDLAKTDATKRTGNVLELFRGQLLRNTLVGVSLAAIGLATFWGVHIFGKDLMRKAAERTHLQTLAADAPASEKEAVLKANFETIKKREMFGMLLVTTGGGLGLVMFGPICERLGRRGAFMLYHIGGLAAGLALFKGMPAADAGALSVALPVFGFLTLGMHAGYAIYFPELYPTRLRGTGGGFCFNVGRVIAAPIIFVGGWMKRPEDLGGLGLSLENAAALLSLLFLLAFVVLIFAPETKGCDLPE